tara:strand:+ start:1074 stop:1796 length:723 start_codon:yes stop_codon:yes gene_type:complete
MPPNKTYLVTGVSSGLGQYLYENIPAALGLHRDNQEEIFEQARQASNLVILHSAFNPRRNISDYSLYVEDNLFLTKELLDLPHQKFVYFSSVDIYGPFNPYSFMKRCAEDMIKKSASDFLILRLSIILGPTIRKNSLTRLIEQEKLSLHPGSVFNYILQSDILEAVMDEKIINQNGIYNFVTSENIGLAQLAVRYDKEPFYGEFKYLTYLESCKEITNLYPYEQRTSLDVADLFVKSYYK